MQRAFVGEGLFGFGVVAQIHMAEADLAQQQGLALVLRFAVDRVRGLEGGQGFRVLALRTKDETTCVQDIFLGVAVTASLKELQRPVEHGQRAGLVAGAVDGGRFLGQPFRGVRRQAIVCARRRRKRQR
jgi:hypothetical protein